MSSTFKVETDLPSAGDFVKSGGGENIPEPSDFDLDNANKEETIAGG